MFCSLIGRSHSELTKSTVGGQEELSGKQQIGNIFLLSRAVGRPAAWVKINTTSSLSEACNSIQEAGLPSQANAPTVTEDLIKACASRKRPGGFSSKSQALELPLD